MKWNLEGPAMYGQPLIQRQAAIPSNMTASEIDRPVIFDRTIGLYRGHDSDTIPADMAVLFVGSWGFEELCARKLWRLLACDLAAKGISSLRFDYPGTGDALDLEVTSDGLEIWHRSIAAAAKILKEQSGADRLILIGHGIGAALALHAAEQMNDVQGLAMLAPALHGRQWIREFMALSKIADHGLIERKVPPTGPMMGEQEIPNRILADLRALDCRNPAHSPIQDLLALTREGRPADEQFLNHMTALGVLAKGVTFHEYGEFAKDVLFSVPPRSAINTITEWVCTLAQSRSLMPVTMSFGAVAIAESPVLSGQGFTEEPVRFGEDGRLYGIISHPDSPPQGMTVMILSTGYDRMSGWGRITAKICRDLAKAGIPAFRFDFSNIADSPPRLGSPGLVVYSESQIMDVREALDFLESRSLTPVIATGRCSGGYTAFKSACLDRRIEGVIAVNVFDFYIDPTDDVEKIISASLQPLSSYGKKMRSSGFWKRVLKREVNVRRGVKNLAKMVTAKVATVLLPVLVMMPIQSNRRKNRIAGFRALNSKHTKLQLIYSDTDVGLHTLEANFGRSGYLLRNFTDVDIDILKGADHNLTTEEARTHWNNKIKLLSKKLKS